VVQSQQPPLTVTCSMPVGHRQVARQAEVAGVFPDSAGHVVEAVQASTIVQQPVLLLLGCTLSPEGPGAEDEAS
jgi:hypothetical protein